jgi:hypothetical protein
MSLLDLPLVTCMVTAPLIRCDDNGAIHTVVPERRLDVDGDHQHGGIHEHD